MNGKKNIFIVDDVQENLQVLGNILKEQGFNISFARDGVQALKGVEKRKPDLILLDVSMPEMDGYEACERLKSDSDTSDIPVIFLTARSEVEDMVKGFRLGAVDYVTKPFHKEELLARVSTHLDLKDAKDIIKRQVEELEKKNEELYQNSITDRLTGVSNRLFLLDFLNREFSKARRKETPLSCIILDIDHFKKVNDSYGHLAGDRILAETAKLINSEVRNEDVFGRYGGEEFLLILPDTTMDEARKVGEKVRTAVESNTVLFEGKELKITISLGLAEYLNSESANEDQLIGSADTALYSAKKSGRNRLVAN